MSVTVVLAGGGKMGGAMLAGWLERGLMPSEILVVEPHADIAVSLADTYRVKVVGHPEDVPADAQPAIVVFAVKPQVLADVVPAYTRFLDIHPVFLSVAAGRTIASLEDLLGGDAAIVRAMPNTPAAIGRGITVGCANGHVTDVQRTACMGLLEAVGEVAWVDDEALMDAVTAVSGSGPAYVFLLAECLADAGVDAGLPADLALRLATATVAGAGELLYRSDDLPHVLRENVTSPGGTTAAALAVLMDSKGLGTLLSSAVSAAAHRSRELAKP